MRLERDPAGLPGAVDALFRAVHSVKSGASSLGLTTIEGVAHAAETLLDGLRESPVAPPEALDALLAAADRAAALVDDPEHSGAADVSALLERLRAALPRPALAIRPAAHDRLFALEVDFTAAYRRDGLSPVRILEAIQRHGVILSAALDVPGADPELGGLPDGPVRYRATVSSALPADAFRAALGFPLDRLAEPDAPPETALATRPSETPALNSPEPAGPAPVEVAGVTVGPAEKATTLRIPVSLVDRLMTLAGELVLIRNQVMQSVGPDDGTLRPIAQRLNGVVSELQDAVMRTRMQPVGNLFNRFPRLVRDLARQLGKEIRLDVLGGDVELDKTVLETLSDPLTHLIRNSCDHGVESPQERAARGKPAEGRVTLSARQQGGQITVSIADDGRGLDPAAIRRKALANALATPSELDRMSERELFGLILLPGFSTAARVTDVSGRGVGMDVVKVNLDRLGGGLEILSEPGRGTTFLLRVPLTLAIIPCLLVRAGGDRFALPQKDLEELVCLHGDQIRERVETAFDQEVVRLRDALLPLVRLGEVMASAKPFTAATRAEALQRRAQEVLGAAGGLLWFAVVRVGDQRFCLAVDEILTPEEIVVKPMHAALRRLGCFSGATILGDGRVALILSVEGVARHVGVRFQSAAALPPAGTRADADAVQNVLLFRVGPDEQFALPLAMIRRVVPLDLTRVERAGGREFVTVDGVPTSIVRLDRLLSVSAPADAASPLLILPKGVRRPLGILVTAVVDTEPVRLEVTPDTCPMDALIGTQVVRGRMTLFLDVYRLADLVEQSERPGRAVAAVASPALRGRRRVLLVEDTQFFRQLVRGYLETLGFEVAAAEDGAAGLARVDAEGPFDLVVSDIEMPVMDGWAFARALRERDAAAGRRTPLVALTTLSSARDRERAAAVGFDRHEVKLDRERFLATIRSLLGISGGEP